MKNSKEEGNLFGMHLKGSGFSYIHQRGTSSSVIRLFNSARVIERTGRICRIHKRSNCLETRVKFNIERDETWQSTRAHKNVVMLYICWCWDIWWAWEGRSNLPPC